MVARCHGSPLSRTVQEEEEEGWESEGEEVVRESLWDGSGVMDHKSLDPWNNYHVGSHPLLLSSCS